jgi:hypothetical protein
VASLVHKLLIASSLGCAMMCLGAFSPANENQAQAQAAPASAHDIADTWQGTLHVGRDLRTIVKITKNDKGAYEGNFYSIDQGSQPFKLDSVTVNGSDVKMDLKLIGVVFTGKLSADGKTIDGNWSQGPNPYLSY